MKEGIFVGCLFCCKRFSILLIEDIVGISPTPLIEGRGRRFRFGVVRGYAEHTLGVPLNTHWATTCRAIVPLGTGMNLSENSCSPCCVGCLIAIFSVCRAIVRRRSSIPSNSLSRSIMASTLYTESPFVPDRCLPMAAPDSPRDPSL